MRFVFKSSSLLMAAAFLSTAFADDSNSGWPTNPQLPPTPTTNTTNSAGSSSSGGVQLGQQQTTQALQIFNNVNYETFSGSKNDFFAGGGLDDSSDQTTFKIGDDNSP